MVVRVGYMGIPFSNTEEMTKIFIKNLKIKESEIVPLMSAANVVNALKKKEIEYGVFAVENKFAGTVEESDVALSSCEHEIISTEWCHIHHCVFVKNKECKVEKLVSHIQALLQSKNNLKKLFPNAELIECEDTAYAAEMLAKNICDDTCAAVCRRDAGEYYNLHLLHENIEDNKENMTKFAIVKLK